MTPYTIRDMPAQVDAESLALLAQVETATVGHWRHLGFMHRGIQSLLRGRRVVGTAVTLAIPGPDSTLLHHAVGLLRPGDILVVDRLGDDRHACWGGAVTLAAKAAGAAAGIVDGPCTDLAEIEASAFPVWARGIAPITTRLYDLGGYLNVPVSCGGAVVMPGDAVLADDSGVLVLPPRRRAPPWPTRRWPARSAGNSANMRCAPERPRSERSPAPVTRCARGCRAPEERGNWGMAEPKSPAMELSGDVKKTILYFLERHFTDTSDLHTLELGVSSATPLFVSRSKSHVCVIDGMGGDGLEASDWLREHGAHSAEVRLIESLYSAPLKQSLDIVLLGEIGRPALLPGIVDALLPALRAGAILILPGLAQHSRHELLCALLEHDDFYGAMTLEDVAFVSCYANADTRRTLLSALDAERYPAFEAQAYVVPHPLPWALEFGGYEKARPAELVRGFRMAAGRPVTEGRHAMVTVPVEPSTGHTAQRPHRGGAGVQGSADRRVGDGGNRAGEARHAPVRR